MQSCETEWAIAKNALSVVEGLRVRASGNFQNLEALAYLQFFRTDQEPLSFGRTFTHQTTFSEWKGFQAQLRAVPSWEEQPQKVPPNSELRLKTRASAPDPVVP